MNPERARWKDLALCLGVTTGYGIPLALITLAMTVGPMSRVSSTLGMVLSPLVGLGILAGWIFATRAAYRHARAGHRAGLSAAWATFVLVVLIGWGLIVDGMTSGACVEGGCEALEGVHRPLAMPEVFGLLALQVAVATAFAVSRRRPEALHPWAEVTLHATLVAGLVMHAAIAVQFADLMPLAFLTLGIGLPALAPLLTLGLLVSELNDRLRRRGAEAVTPPETSPTEQPVYRGVDLPPDAPPTRGALHVPTLVRAVAVSPLVLGAHAVLQGLWLHETTGVFRVFTNTCGHALSTLPIQHVTQDCHYLCTIAAQGHPWLVRPERMGRRGGVAIVVNRQLALANAFEDLLHDRWPRFGALCRRVYDRVGIPISNALRRRWLADAVYLAMKPAEWGFYLALLLLDRGDPEARIARMYR